MSNEAEIGEIISSEQVAAKRALRDAQVAYQIYAAEMLKNQGTELKSQGKYKLALEKFVSAKNNLKDISASKAKDIVLSCSLEMMSCYMETKQYEECFEESTEVLAYDSNNVLARYLRDQACKKLKRGEAGSGARETCKLILEDETITENLRNSEERLNREGGDIIEEITEEATLSSVSENLTSKSPILSVQETSQSNTSRSASHAMPQSSNNDNFKVLKDIQNLSVVEKLKIVVPPSISL